MADDAVCFRLASVNVRQAKFALLSRALAARHALQAWVQEQWHAANVSHIAGFEAIVAALNEEPDTTEAMDALDKYASKVEQVCVL
jgi:hypothetical protein